MHLTLGIEEELIVVDADTGDAVADPDPAIFETCAANRGPHQVVNELLRSQIETGTRVCASIAELRSSLRETRRIVIDGARRHGAAVIASSAPAPRASEESIEHGRWLAQRYGTLAFLPAGDPPKPVDIEDSSRELVGELRDDADALRCRSELEHIGHVIRYGSSADRQEDVYRQRRLDGASHDAALKAVVDAVIDETEAVPGVAEH